MEEGKQQAAKAEPLPIWFFVGIILLAYGLIVLGSDLAGNTRQTVLGDTRPGLWWGAIMALAGLGFTAIGLRVHRQAGGGGGAS
jgi:hypothetical protein